MAMYEEPECKKSIYHLLDDHKKQIRLLTFVSRDDSCYGLAKIGSEQSDTICCNLEIVDLVEKPEFYALSYTWGIITQDQTYNITLNGVPMSVGLNLGSFLRSIRDHHRDLKPAKFWVDFLCIDQADVKERNHQVAMMGDIYGSAVATISWLGLGHPYSPLKLLAALALESGGDEKELHSHFYDWWERDEFVIDSDFRDIFKRPYWTRAWIVQELILGRRVLLLCGRDRIDWRDFLTCWQLHASAVESKGMTFGYTLEYKGKFIEVQYLKEKEQPNSLFEMVDAIHDFECKDPRDKVYGFLGMAESAARDIISINYQKSPLQVFTDFLRYKRTCYRETTHTWTPCKLWNSMDIENTDSLVMSAQLDSTPVHLEVYPAGYVEKITALKVDIPGKVGNKTPNPTDPSLVPKFEASCRLFYVSTSWQVDYLVLSNENLEPGFVCVMVDEQPPTHRKDSLKDLYKIQSFPLLILLKRGADDVPHVVGRGKCLPSNSNADLGYVTRHQRDLLKMFHPLSEYVLAEGYNYLRPEELQYAPKTIGIVRLNSAAVWEYMYGAGKDPGDERTLYSAYRSLRRKDVVHRKTYMRNHVIEL